MGPVTRASFCALGKILKKSVWILTDIVKIMKLRVLFSGLSCEYNFFGSIKVSKYITNDAIIDRTRSYTTYNSQTEINPIDVNRIYNKIYFALFSVYKIVCKLLYFFYIINFFIFFFV